METKTKNKITFFLLLIVIVILIFLAYFSGNYNGVLLGFSNSQILHNESVCSYLITISNTSYIDTNGICHIETKQEYSHIINCNWEKFKFDGNESLSNFEIIKLRLFLIGYYPLLRCW